VFLQLVLQKHCGVLKISYYENVLNRFLLSIQEQRGEYIDLSFLGVNP
jgi:hypothetical protein